ncbi:jg5845 [Pararge aegeria aegeria]|uniref:Jg5845 protein n=1 Tax=Pararge aegeria aegeria TaxID=348720 RepID=A0A8S4SCI5_9NEOP|nr:jg5845 [Pararge aegeria aegeria]
MLTLMPCREQGMSLFKQPIDFILGMELVERTASDIGYPRKPTVPTKFRKPTFKNRTRATAGSLQRDEHPPEVLRCSTGNKIEEIHSENITNLFIMINIDVLLKVKVNSHLKPSGWINSI